MKTSINFERDTYHNVVTDIATKSVDRKTTFGNETNDWDLFLNNSTVLYFKNR